MENGTNTGNFLTKNGKKLWILLGHFIKNGENTGFWLAILAKIAQNRKNTGFYLQKFPENGKILDNPVYTGTGVTSIGPNLPCSTNSSINGTYTGRYRDSPV